MSVPSAEQPRIMRECDHCHQVDDASHHQVAVNSPDGLVVFSRHFRCCAENGCPDGSCHAILNRSPGVQP